MKATIFDIKKFAIHDGPGIRTTVFLKGCPLNCIWCHNPEGISAEQELTFLKHKCTFCGKCVVNCSQKTSVHTVATSQSTGEPFHHIEYSRCIACGQCTTACTSGALSITGEEKTVAEIMREVMKDKSYYDTSGGGLTISGGEPMMQFEFLKELLTAAKTERLYTCVDTCGFAPQKRYEEIVDLVDLFHYDFKESDPGKHFEYTGVKNDLIIDNLKFLDRKGAKIILRCPIIPGINDREEHFKEIAKLANGLSNVLEIHIMPFHPWGSSKGRKNNHQEEGTGSRQKDKYRLSDIPAVEPETAIKWIGLLQELTEIQVKKG